jgi:hypothetical protein
MIGHLPIIKMRMNRVAPAVVFLNDFEDKKAKDWLNPGEKYGEVWPSDHATVSINPNEPVSNLDLRFLNGLRVLISGSTEERTKALYKRSIDAGAKTVAASHMIFSGPFGRVTTGWFEIHHG